MHNLLKHLLKYKTDQSKNDQAYLHTRRIVRVIMIKNHLYYLVLNKEFERLKIASTIKLFINNDKPVCLSNHKTSYKTSWLLYLWITSKIPCVP